MNTKNKSAVWDYHNQYNKEHYDQVNLKLPKGTKRMIKRYSKDNGISQRETVSRALNKLFKASGYLILVVCLCAGLVGCHKKEHVLNEDRGMEYTYDFVDYVDITVYGSEGNGFVQIQPKDISVNDFPSESDYIAVKKVIDELQLYCVPGYDVNTSLKVTPSSGLSNGDTVTVSVDGGYFNNPADVVGNLSFNIEPYEFEVQGLGQEQTVDLFNTELVKFYALQGTNEIYPIVSKDTTLDSELTDNLVYTIETNDIDLVADKTILDITVSMKEDFLKNAEHPYYTLDVYLGKHGLIASNTAEKVLNTVVSPIDWDSVNLEIVRQGLFDSIYNLEQTYGRELTAVDTIHEALEHTLSGTDEYTYYVVYHDTYWNGESDVTDYYRSKVRMVYVNDTLQVLSIANPEQTQERYLTTPYDNHKINTSWYVGETITDSGEEEVGEEEVNAVSEVDESAYETTAPVPTPNPLEDESD